MTASDSDSPRGVYARELASRQSSLAQTVRSADRLGNLRLGLALVGLGFVIAPLVLRDGTTWWLLIPLFIIFVVLGRRQDVVFDRRRRLSAAVRFYEQGVDRLEERWRALQDDGADLATQWEQKAHHAQDLDVFGPASLFQLLCRATTAHGRRVLASWLATSAGPEQVTERQEATRELKELLTFREHLAVAAAGEDSAVLRDEGLLAWAETDGDLPHKALLRVLGFVQPIVLACAAIPWILGSTRIPLLIAALLQVGTIMWTRGMVEERAQVLSGPDKVLTRYLRLIETIEAEQFHSTLLLRLKGNLGSGAVASERIRQLHKYVEMLDARLNMFFALSIGPALLWDLNLVLRAEAWRKAVGPQLRAWLETIGEMEAAASFAALWYERPDYCLPTFVDEPGRFDAVGMTHPLIDLSSVVSNDLELGAPGSVLLLSGSNMSGKSTLLRAAGINLVLAHAGAPVAARSLELCQTELVTSVRIVDSLAEGTSHFYAELKRLKYIVDVTRRSDKHVLYLLDEMLHGTNSRERYIGAVSVIAWLSGAKATGIVTTHDLALARIEEELDEGLVRNMHLSDEVVEGEICFDYRLREGPVTSTNALRLMRAVGIDVEFKELPPRGV